jgi:hypothetical protein
MPLKQLQELINREDSGWPLVQQWVAEATNPVEVLPPPDDASRERSLLATQVTTRSPMGAIIYESGGILVDHCWLRILGAGHPRLPRSLPGWNFGRSISVSGQQPPFVLVADDVVGGFFAIDGGGLGVERGKVCYHAPDTLKWENTEKGYSDFLVWCFRGDLAKYYEGMRWPGWLHESEALAGDHVFGIYPFLSAADPPLGERSRRPVSIAEIYDLHIGMRATENVQNGE